MTKNILNLLNYKFNKYSSAGDDGIIEFVINTIGIKKGKFVEFGAWDGVFKSNCKNLVDKGWSGIFIELDHHRYKVLKKNYKNNKNIICLNKKVEFSEASKFDNIVDKYLNGDNIDFCSIDIDGLDVEVFETFEKYLPTIVCIESGFILPPLHKRVPSSVAIKTVQQSLSLTVDVFEEKGYEIICAGLNCYFVKKEFYYLFNVSDDLLTLYFDGLRSFSQWIPSIWRKLKKVDGMKEYTNDIVLEILEKTGYKIKKDSCGNRKKWARKKNDIIMQVIFEIEQREKRIANENFIYI